MADKTTQITTINVELGKRSYPIHIGPGLLKSVGQMIVTLRPGARCAIITDETVYALHGAALEQSLGDQKIDFSTIVVAPGETSKSMAVLENVVSQLLDAKLERGDLVIAFGGGVIGDLAGFVAAITRRGMDFVQIPTTVLAQVDSSVGGKTGINAQQGKNLIGAFHQPVLVLADSDILKTLSARDFSAGYAEIAKYGLINQPEFFAWLEKNHKAVFAFEPALGEAIAISCRAKAQIVAEDEYEAGNRALLNLGHTFGHALETATGYDSARLVHGEGVAIGIVAAFRFSNRLNLCSLDDAERVETHLAACGLPTRLSNIKGDLPGPEKLMEFIAQDKKVSAGKLNFILARGIGKAFIAKNIAAAEVLAFLNEEEKR